MLKSLHLTARISADGMLHLPVAEFADQEVEVIVLAAAHRKTPPVLSGQEALQKAQEVGFIGSFEAEPDFSVRYKEMLDWSSKA